MLLNSLLSNLTPFFAPVETPSPTAVPPKELERTDILNLLGDEDDKDEIIDLKEPKEKKDEKEVKEIKEDKEELEDEEKEEKEEKEEVELEDEDEDKEPAEENLELVTPVRRKEILAKYPSLFKDFPYLNNAYYREQAFTDVFPDPEDAKIAAEKAEALDAFEADLQKGSIQKVLETIKKDDINAFYNIVDNLFQQLADVDEKAHTHVTGNVIKSAVKAMALEAKRTGDEELKKAAIALNKFVFATSEYTEPTLLAKEPVKKDDTKESEVDKERKVFLKERFDAAQTSLNSRIDRILKATVEGNIDPKNSMTPFIKKHAIKEAIDEVVKSVSSDTRFTKTLDKLWDAALKDKFSEGSMKKIKDAYLSKAKTLLPGAIKNSRNEALKGMGKRLKDEDVELEDNEDDNAEERTSPPRNRTRQPRTSDTPPKKGKPEGMTTKDFLMKD